MTAVSRAVGAASVCPPVTGHACGRVLRDSLRLLSFRGRLRGIVRCAELHGGLPWSPGMQPVIVASGRDVAHRGEVHERKTACRQPGSRSACGTRSDAIKSPSSCDERETRWVLVAIIDDSDMRSPGDNGGCQVLEAGPHLHEERTVLAYVDGGTPSGVARDFEHLVQRYLSMDQQR